MGIGSTLGSIGGAVVGSMFGAPSVGASIGGMLGGALDGKSGESDLDDYSAYQLQKEKEWDNTFGPIEKNLAAHYSNMNANNVIAKGNEALEKQFAAQNQRWQAELEVRGLDINGGISTSLMDTQLAQHSIAKAKLVANADDYVAKQQQEFYAGMASARPNAQTALNSSATQSLNEQKYNDKQEQAGMASAMDIGTEIFKGLGLGKGGSLSTNRNITHERTF